MIPGLKEATEQLSNKDLLEKTILMARIGELSNQPDMELFRLHYDTLIKRLQLWLDETSHLDMEEDEWNSYLKSPNNQP